MYLSFPLQILLEISLHNFSLIWLILLKNPSEFTTMAGRRLRDAVKTVLTTGANKEFNSNVHVVIAGLTNTYSQYVTTFEEYKMQRYEVSELVFQPFVYLSSIFNVLFLTFRTFYLFHFGP